MDGKMLSLLWFVALLALPASLPSQDNKTSDSRQKELDARPEEQKSENFKLALTGVERAMDRTPLGFRIYQGSRGTKVFITYGTFGSPEKAETELRLWLQPVKKVLSQEQKKDALGQTNGYRATAVYTDTNTKREFNAILWTNGPDFWQLECASMATALDFEKRINNEEPLSAR